MARIIGISGGVASGKTTVARILSERGAHVIDADAIGHEVLAEPEIRRRIVSQWGEGVLDGQGAISRGKLGAIVFADARELKRLEEIVHPAILERIRAEIEQRSKGSEVIVLDAALLNESGLADLCDGVIFVEAGDAARTARARGRGWTDADCAARERHQMGIAEKRTRADWIVDNSRSIEEIEGQLRALWQDIVRQKGS